MHAMPDGFKRFSLSAPLPNCTRWKDHMPFQRDPAAYSLYIEARKVWRSKIGWQLTGSETKRILTDVSKAAEMGDWGARALMAHFYLYGLGVLESNHVLDAAPEKAIEIQRMAAKAGQPWGLYDLGVAHERGYGGVPLDEELAWAYYLRAAELGSPDAQMALASAYGKAGRLQDQEMMLKCAYKQGNGAAAYQLGILAEIGRRFKDAIILYQEGVKFGNADCAAMLELLFMRGYWINASDDDINSLRELQIMRDAERERRYNAIHEALMINPDLKLTQLEAVLPLPPAPLPDWSGVVDAVEIESNAPPTY